ncbi:MAG: DUF393 domain-containing protein [Pirellulales bacterium]|nr:DUF393 domain-containing protein [Pirellulales bacterium]
MRLAARPNEIEVFFDGGCPLCLREINMLRRWDKNEKILFTDIEASDFNATDLGKTQEELMAQIHGRTPDGQMIVGVEVFRRLYAAVGFGWLVWLSRWPVIRQALDLGYWVFARNRLWLTGRQFLTGSQCVDGKCVLRTKEAPSSPAGH